MRQARYIYDELSTKNCSPARVKQLSDQLDQLDIASKNLESAAQRFAGSASPAPQIGPSWQMNPGDDDNGFAFKGSVPEWKTASARHRCTRWTGSRLPH